MMDPDTTLADALAVARPLADAGPDTPAPALAHALAEAVLALDEWIAKGGYLPARWRATNPRDAAVVARVRAGDTYATVAKAIGVSRQRIEQIVNRNAPEVAVARRAERAAAAALKRRCWCGRAKAPQAVRCRHCALAAGTVGGQQRWTREVIIERLHAWVDLYGTTPAATDWSPALARKHGNVAAAERFERDKCWPYLTTVRERFGGWNVALIAAGLPVRRPGIKRSDVRDGSIAGRWPR